MPESHLSPSQGFRPNGITSSLPVNFDYGSLKPSGEITPSALRENAELLSKRLQEAQGDQEAQQNTAESVETVTTWRDTRAVTEQVSWLWDGWLPNGFVTLIAAESGQGKSLLTLWIAGYFITGELFPTGGGCVAQRGKVLWIETEHAQALNLERVTKFGLDDSCFINPLPGELDTVELGNPEHRDAILKRALLPEVVVIVIDSLSGSHRLQENSTEMMEVMSFIAFLATRTNKPVLLTHHFNKLLSEGGLPSLGRVRGSSSIVQLCRIIWAIDTPNQQDPGHKRLSIIKNSFGIPPDPIGFRIADNSLVFTDAPQPTQQSSRVDEAAEWLRDVLEEGEVAQREIERRAKEDGLNMPAVKRAKKPLKVKSDKKADGWYWSLPPEEDHSEREESVEPLDPVEPLDFFNGEADREGDK